MERKNQIQDSKKFIPISIMTIIKKIVRKPYYYVPPCPKCGSKITGRFMRKLASQYESDWRNAESLRNGEIIAPSNDLRDGNCFCVSCGHTWHGLVELKLMPLLKIEDEKHDRKTETIMSRYEEKKERMKPPEKKKPGMVRRFIGHI